MPWVTLSYKLILKVGMVVNSKKHPIKEIVDLKEGNRLAICRCWQSKSFPFCDGGNESTGDSLGPIIVERGEKD
ncbi:MAG TPA: CDGSH iron-sulfur domain-containing protein [Gammaproteobacteria bacterium]|nr:CDGSH iron-sulfur domain-containing protein [Gammaproteobacteria bacterium]